MHHFDKDHLYRVALPMGGIGTGSVSLSGRGELCDWEIMNIPNKGSLSGECDGIGRSFFAVRAKGAKLNVARMLAGPLNEWEYLNSEGQPVPQAGLPRFGGTSFDGAFPFGIVHLSDASVPLKVDIKGFSPFIPGDSADSSLPVASLEYVVENTTDEPLEVSVVGFVRNIVGNNGYPKRWSSKSFAYADGEKDNRIARREAGGLQGVMCWSDGVATNSDAWGSIALFELDSYATPVIMMAPSPGDTLDPEVERKYRAALKYDGKIDRVERYAFYERAKKAYAVILSGETAKYGNIILKKGVTPIG